MSGNSVVNMGEFSKPATVLIEKISDALGGAFKPYQIMRVAKAEAEAEIIRAHTEIEVQDIRMRAGRRFLEEETRNQINIETITAKALPMLRDDANPGEVENDWIANFFDKCRLISDDEMQQLWAAVLSGEANQPGTFSKRTVNTLSSLDKRDAELFQNLCTFTWNIFDNTPLVFNDSEFIYLKHGIDFSSLCHLRDIGVTQLDEFSLTRVTKNITVFYFKQPVSLAFANENNNTFRIGQVRFTQTGRELASICYAEPDQDFFEYVCNKWRQEGLIKEVPPFNPE